MGKENMVHFPYQLGDCTIHDYDQLRAQIDGLNYCKNILHEQLESHEEELLEECESLLERCQKNGWIEPVPLQKQCNIG